MQELQLDYNLTLHDKPDRDLLILVEVSSFTYN